MILIDKPFISNFLLKTIKDYNFPIVSTAEAGQLISDDTLNWFKEEDSAKFLKETENFKLISNSENSIKWIEEHLTSTKLPKQIDTFKNKIKFRDLLKDYFPDYFYKGLHYKDLKNIETKSLPFPIILKPAVGFFSLAVYKVDNENEWHNVIDKIESDINKISGIYPKEVLNLTDFIIEEFIRGEEYAIDCYFNETGTPVILNVFHHLFSTENDVNDRIYSSSKEIIEKYYNEINDFLKIIGQETEIKNFPAHIEIRIDADGKLIPIEVNPLRFGGWCTTGDLSWYAYGINSYEYFLMNKIPDWNEIFEHKSTKKYSIIVVDNNSGIDVKDIESFDYNLLKSEFKNVLDIREVDFEKFKIFGFIFIETDCKDSTELNYILHSNLHKYIKLK